MPKCVVLALIVRCRTAQMAHELDLIKDVLRNLAKARAKVLAATRDRSRANAFAIYDLRQQFNSSVRRGGAVVGHA